MEVLSDASAIHQGGHHPDGPIPSRRRATRILKGTATYSDRFVPNHTELTEVLVDLCSRGCIIVFMMGVWDLFHIGHADYIHKGKEEAAKLYPEAEHVIMVVGVDTDALTKERKGPQRPIVPEDERRRVLSHLRSVDIITMQYEFNQLYGVVSPHVQIVSTSTKDLPPGMDEARSHCEHLVSLPPQAETSTTARIRRLAFDGSLETLKAVSAKLMKAIEEARGELTP
jgi:D-beta-D-heptose 7-phosphate kinase/D-beta-D-heptose 1-phosphate adenosyltransferase